MPLASDGTGCANWLTSLSVSFKLWLPKITFLKRATLALDALFLTHHHWFIYLSALKITRCVCTHCILNEVAQILFPFHPLCNIRALTDQIKWSATNGFIWNHHYVRDQPLQHVQYQSITVLSAAVREVLKLISVYRGNNEAVLDFVLLSGHLLEFERSLVCLRKTKSTEGESATQAGGSCEVLIYHYGAAWPWCCP